MLLTRITSQVPSPPTRCLEPSACGYAELAYAAMLAHYAMPGTKLVYAATPGQVDAR